MEDVHFRILEPGEGEVLGRAIRAAYGDSYDSAWVYDPDEVSARLEDGRYVSCVAEAPGGELLCHVGLARGSGEDRVGHSGQAVTMRSARGQHLFTRTKHHLAEWARGAGLAGMYMEATAAHPYSQLANVELGAVETGFLLGWIPSTVSNDAAAGTPRRESAALLYLKTGDGDDRPVHAPARHHAVVAQTVRACRLRGRPATPPAGLRPPARTELRTEVRADHNFAILAVTVPGADLDEVVGAERHHLFRRGLDAVYVDLPLERPETALVSSHLERLGVSYAGIFPNPHADGDVLRMQSLHRVRVSAADVAVGSDHGRELLDYVLTDLPEGCRQD